jgi:hypothetical protein
MLNTGGIINPSYVGFMHEPLWAFTNNSNPFNVIQNGWASLQPPGTAGWDGILQFPGQPPKNVQLKAVVPEGHLMVNNNGLEILRKPHNVQNTVGNHAGTARGYGSNEQMLVTSEAADDLVSRVGNTSQAGDSGVSYTEAEQLAKETGQVPRGIKPSEMSGWRFQLWRESGFWRAANAMAKRAATRAGLLSAVITGGFSTYFNLKAYRNGEIDGAQAGANIVLDTGTGAVTGLAAGWTGAMAGAAVGSVVPIFGNAVGFVTGFIVGTAVGFGVSTVINKLTLPLRTKVAEGFRAWQGVGENVGVIIDHVGNQLSEVSDNIQTTVNNTMDSIRNTVTDVAETLEQTADNIGTAVDTAIENVSSTVGNAAKKASNAVSDFFGGLFGGGS